MKEKYFAVISGSDSVAVERLRISKDVLSKSRIKCGDLVEVSVNGKKTALVVDYGEGRGRIEINSVLADALGMKGSHLANIKKIKSREIKDALLRVKGAGVEVDPDVLVANLVLRPITRGSVLLVFSGNGLSEVEVLDCNPREGVVSRNTRIVIS